MSSTADDVAVIWIELLQVDHPLAADDFFASGGDSVAAMIMTFYLSEKFGVEVLPEMIFDAPTFGALCALIDKRLSQPAL